MLKVYNICIGPKIRMWNGQQDDEDDAEKGRGVAAAIGGGVAGDVKFNGGDANEDDDKTGMGWESNDDNE